ncbi:unnamed protein product [Timema podura]|uniref:Tex-like protein N-terminal domain-containing protein n=1 Tax=Timema podura TaxID=61482 RepID=A0ABN7NTM3_TIMPD|nr:unnamed protein product [Timema podura]
MLNIEEDVSKNIITLLEDENTIPFIARYRQELTGNMDADKLREAKECYEDIVTLKHKAESTLKLISKKGQLTPQLESTISLACTLEELDLIHCFSLFLKCLLCLTPIGKQLANIVLHSDFDDERWIPVQSSFEYKSKENAALYEKLTEK